MSQAKVDKYKKEKANRKKEEEESRSHEEYLKRIEEDPLWELKQRSRKNTPAQRGIPPVQKNLQNPYAAYDAGYDDVMEGDDYDWDRYRRDSSSSFFFCNSISSARSLFLRSSSSRLLSSIFSALCCSQYMPSKARL